MAAPYRGRVEYASSGQSAIEIDDLDAPNWQGRPTGGFLISGNAPDVWFVGVVLLDGARAGEFSTADLIVRREHSKGEPSVRFAGRSAFAPHPELVDLDASLRRYEDLRRRMPPPPVIEDYADKEPELSVFKRPRRPRDESLEPRGRAHMPVRAETVRLALDELNRRVYVAEGTDEDSIFLIYRGVGGGGACGSSRSSLATYGLIHMTNRSSAGDDVIVGLVPDDVIAVHLDERPAVMGENVFIAHGGSAGRTLTLTTRLGQRKVPVGGLEDGEEPPPPKSG
ncbi:MAG: hypothetical protein ACRDWD_01565 [Acidimicrobiia bacterium]